MLKKFFNKAVGINRENKKNRMYKLNLNVISSGGEVGLSLYFEDENKAVSERNTIIPYLISEKERPGSTDGIVLVANFDSVYCKGKVVVISNMVEVFSIVRVHPIAVPGEDDVFPAVLIKYFGEYPDTSELVCRNMPSAKVFFPQRLKNYNPYSRVEYTSNNERFVKWIKDFVSFVENAKSVFDVKKKYFSSIITIFDDKIRNVPYLSLVKTLDEGSIPAILDELYVDNIPYYFYNGRKFEVIAAYGEPKEEEK